MLAVAALRDNDRNRARQLLGGLAQEFPGNPLYRQELAKLQ
jgi:predicted Zn-dependent protease